MREFLWSKLSQARQYLYFELSNSLLWAPVLCFVGYLAASLASTH